MPLIPSEYVEPFPASGNRQHLKGGMEIQIFLLAVWCGGMPAFPILANITRHTVWLLAIPLVLFLGIRAVGRWMASRDPYMVAVYLGALKYRKNYAALTQLPQYVIKRKN